MLQHLGSANHGKFVQIPQKEVTNICSNCAQLIDLHIRSVTDLCNAMVSRKNNFLAKNTDFTHDCLGFGRGVSNLELLMENFEFEYLKIHPLPRRPHLDLERSMGPSMEDLLNSVETMLKTGRLPFRYNM